MTTKTTISIIDDTIIEGGETMDLSGNPKSTPLRNDDIIFKRGAIHAYHRDAIVDKDGSVDLSQLRDDEVVVSPGKIYRRLIK